MTAGRPSLYRVEYAEQARKLCELGATDKQLADFFNVSLRTISSWQTEHQEFLQALKVGKTEADENVARSLYNRAMGYSHEAVKIFMPSGASAPVYAPYVEHVPPDVTACIFWLKNRRPQEWRDQRDLTVKHDYSDMETVDQLIDAVAKECGESMAKRLMELTNDEQARLVEIAPDSTHDGSESVQ